MVKTSIFLKAFHFLHIKVFRRIIVHYENKYINSRLGYCAPTGNISEPKRCREPHKIFIYDHANIYPGAKFVMNPNSEKGKFILKKWSGAAEGLTVITDNHATHPIIGHWYKQDSVSHVIDRDEDIIVEEDVWVGENVTLLPGVIIGRGSIIGAGSVVRKKVPPYAMVVGNPAKIVGFKLIPEEIIEHEKILYAEKDRLSEELLNKNYEKYFTTKMKEIKNFLN